VDESGKIRTQMVTHNISLMRQCMGSFVPYYLATVTVRIRVVGCLFSENEAISLLVRIICETWLTK
jgi:hypothetical protein